MKKSYSKRALSVLLCVLMLFTSFPASLIAEAAAVSQSGAYLMAYFTGEDNGEQVAFAVSKDGYNYEPLNGESPIVSAFGSGIGSEHMRDPYMFKGQDGKFYLIATDLNANSTNYSNHAFYVYKSSDLVTWVMHSHIDMNDYISGTTRAWAPQVLWDSAQGKYMLYWANQVNSGTTILYWAYSSDLATIETTPQVLFDPATVNANGTDAIDGDIIYDSVSGTYYLYYKDETTGGTAGIHMAQATAANGPYSYIGPAIPDSMLPNDENEAAREGCQMYNITGTKTWIMIADKFKSKSDKGFVMYETADFVNFTEVPVSEYTINQACNPRHGCVMHITVAEYDRLCKAYGKATATQSGLRQGEDAIDDLLIARYFADYNNVSSDASGNNNELASVPNLTMTTSQNLVAAEFNGSAYASVPTKAMFTKHGVSLKDGMTVAFRGYGFTGTDHQHVYDFSNSDVFNKITGNWLSSNKNNYSCFFFEQNGRFEAMYKGDELKYEQGAAGSADQWHTYSMTFSKNTLTYYCDGALIASYKKQTQVNDDWFNHTFLSDTSTLGIGISSWVDDPKLSGQISDFCIFKRALTGSEAYKALEDLLDAPEVSASQIDPSRQMYFDNCGSDDKYTDTGSDETYGAAIVQDSTYGSVLNTGGSVINSYVPSFSNTEKEKDGYTISMTVNPGASIDSGNIINIGNKLTITENGTLNFTSGSSTYTATNIFDGKLEANKWQNVTIQVTKNFAFERVFVYIDSVEVSVIDTYMNIPEGSQYPAETMKSAVFESGTRNVSYGPADCMLNNVRIFKGCLSRNDLYEHEMDVYAATIINDTIEKFLEKIRTFSGDNVLTNVGPAYKAYDACCRYLDSIKYGDTVPNPDTYAKLAANLREAIDAMDNFSPLVANASYMVNGWDATENGYASGVLWTNTTMVSNDEDASDKITFGADLSAADPFNIPDNGTWMCRANLLYGDTVFLYSGDDTKFYMPVATAFQTSKDSSNSRRLMLVYPCAGSDDPANTKVFTLEGDIKNGGNYDNNGAWRGYDNKEKIVFSGISGKNDLVGWRSENTNNNYGASVGRGGWALSRANSATYFWYNTMQFRPAELNGNGSNYSGYSAFEYADKNVDTSSWLGKSTIAGKYNISWAIATENADSWDKNKPAWTYDQIKTEYANHATTFSFNRKAVYVVDRSNIVEILHSEELVNNISAIETFTTDSAQAYCDAIDKLTAIDNNYNLSNGTAGAEDLQYNIDEAVNEYENAVLDKENRELIDKGNYYALKQDILNETYIEAATNPDYSKYTTDSIDEFIGTYNRIKQHFTNMNPELGEDSEDYISSDELTGGYFNGRLDVNYSRLMEKVDYTELKEYNASNGAETLMSTDEEGEEVQNYTYGSYQPYNEVRNLANAVINNRVAPGGNIMRDLDGNLLADSNGKALNFGEENTPAYNYSKSIVLDGKTYYITNHDDPSAQQEVVTHTYEEYKPRREALAPCADYSAYNEATNLLYYQDMAAFDPDYLRGGNTPYDILEKQGTRTSSVTYNYGISSTSERSVTVDTPAFNEDVKDNAYITANGRVYMNCGNQDTLDGVTTNILTSLKEANEGSGNIRRKCTVTFNIDNDGAVTTKTETVNYGESFTATVGDLNCFKWAITEDGSTLEHPGSSSYTTYIEKNVTITAYCSPSVTDTGEVVKLKVLNLYGEVMQEYNVAADSVLTLADGSYSINGTSVNSVSYPYYAFLGWSINNRNAELGDYTVSDKAVNNELVLKPRYSLVSSPLNVSMDGTNSAHSYDETFTVNAADGGYGIAARIGDEYYVVTYGTSYTFFVAQSIDMFTIYKTGDVYTIDGTEITDSELIRKLNNKLPFAYSLVATDGKFTTYSAVSDKTLAEVTEVGTIYTLDASIAANPDAFVLGTAGVYQVKAKNKLDTQQYFLRFASTNGQTVYTRAYVKYKFAPSVEFIDGDKQQTLVQTIDYGNVCHN